MNMISVKIKELTNEAQRLEEKGRSALAQSFIDRANEIRKRKSFQVPSDIKKGSWYTVSEDPSKRVMSKLSHCEESMKDRVAAQLQKLTRQERKALIKSFGLAHLVN